MLQELRKFFKSTSFSKAILIGIAVTLPILWGIQFDHFEIGLAICFGAFWCSPSDVSGSIQHKTVGILSATVLMVLVTFIGGFLHLTGYFILPILGALTFFIAFISVFGFRASLISFSGLLALVLSFAHTSEELKIYEYALWIGAGGLWYLLLTLVWDRINPKAQTEELLRGTFELTADFLKTRGELIGPSANRKPLLTKLLQLQTSLTEHHASLREVLFQSRKYSGRSNYQGKRLLVFVQLVEILETAIANPVNYDKMDAVFTAHPEFNKSFQSILFELSSQLHHIGKSSKNPKKFPKNTSLLSAIKELKLELANLKKHGNTTDYEVYIMLLNLLDYQQKLVDKTNRIKWLFGNPNLRRNDYLDSAQLKRYIIPQDYDPKLALRNLSFKSPIFKHSLRLAVTMMLGYAVGVFFKFQNPYWILLTIIVIMRPSYGLTKTRSKDRIIGTVIGGVVATGLVYLIHDPYVYGILGVVSLIIAFAMVQRNYKTSAAFITLSVVFIYAIIRPDIFTVIQFRILDTLIGAGLSFVAMLLLWPAWGFSEIGTTIEHSIEANRHFLAKIHHYYLRKGKLPTSYTIARKTAFLETANLSAAFQRIVQEPASKQKNRDEIYELVALNQSLLAALSSMSTYIQHQPTTPASDLFHEKVVEIDEILVQAVKNIQQKSHSSDLPFEQIRTQRVDYTMPIDEIPTASTRVLNTEDLHKEAHLISEQLQWLTSISEKIKCLTAEVNW